MTTATNSFSEFLEKARAGDDDALNEIARTYEPDLRIAARVHLGPALRPYLDSIDLVQSVHRSLIRGLRDDRLQPGDSAALIALALTMVRRKVARQWRRHRRQMRIDSRLDPHENTNDVLSTLTGRVAEPGRTVAGKDAIDNLFQQLDAADRQLLELRLQGWNTAEAAQQTGQTPEALRIRLHRLRKRLAEEGIGSEWL